LTLTTNFPFAYSPGPFQEKYSALFENVRERYVAAGVLLVHARDSDLLDDVPRIQEAKPILASKPMIQPRKTQAPTIMHQPAAQLYDRFVESIQPRIQAAQLKAVLAANAELRVILSPAVTESAQSAAGARRCRQNDA